MTNAAVTLERDIERSPAAENPVEKLAEQLQRLPSEIRWLVASMQGAVQARGEGSEPIYGPFERRGRKMLALAGAFGLQRACCFTVNFLLLAHVFTRQNRVRSVSAPEGALFIGIHAVRETELLHQFAGLQPRPVVHIDERELTDFFRYGRVPLRKLLREMRDVWREFDAQFRRARLPQEISALDVLTTLALRGHRFAYLRAWFRQYLERRGAARLLACTAASHVAFAAIAAGAEVVYLLHGLQRRSIVYPDFSRALCFTGIEAAHLRRRLPKCAVSIKTDTPRPLESRRVAAVAGIFWKTDEFDRVRPFIQWALDNDLPVVVRKHPFDDSDYWAQWAGVSGVQIDEGQGSFEQFLASVKPRIVATWYSTVLFDALAVGIIPVTVCPDSREFLDIVYPIRALALCWPRDAGRARVLIDDEKCRADFVSGGYRAAMGEA